MAGAGSASARGGARCYLSDVDLHEASDVAILLQRDDQVDDGGEGEHHKHCGRASRLRAGPTAPPKSQISRHGIGPHTLAGHSPQKRGSWKWLPPLTKKMMEMRPMSTSTPVSISASGLLQNRGTGSSTGGTAGGGEAPFPPVQVNHPLPPLVLTPKPGEQQDQTPHPQHRWGPTAAQGAARPGKLVIKQIGNEETDTENVS